MSARIHSEYSTEELSKKTWPDFEKLFRQRGTGDGWWCWCTYHHQLSYSAAEKKKPRTRVARSVINRLEKKSLVENGQAHGILVYDNGESVGWCQYGLKEELPRIDNRQKYRTLAVQNATDNKLWRITCFVVDKNHRRRGVASTALNAALDAISKRGGGLVEAYPVSKTDQGSNYLYSGTVTMFEKAGFKMVAPLGEGRTTTVVMRRTI
jgi:ribosomal protein S18 acetylase RimI-like enzyme